MKLPVALCVAGLVALCAGAAPDEDSAARFTRECAALAGQGEGQVVRGSDGWLFLRNELRHLSAAPFWRTEPVTEAGADPAGKDDPLTAILDTKSQLDKLGIRLILVPVPAKAAIYPDKLLKDFKADPAVRLDARNAEFYRLLAARGVDVLDLGPAFAAARNDAEGALFCRQDSHWSGRACAIAARMIAEKLKAEPWLKGATGTVFTATAAEARIEGDLKAMLNDASLPPETVALRKVELNGAPLEPAERSPVLLMGDSHCLVFQAGGDMLATSSGLASQLALELGMPVDWIGVRGSGARPARIQLFRRAKTPGYIESKKVVVWCFTAREFTEASGWGIVPVVAK
jgi:alginate O-acetyltransferase complex protein AlgJ